MAEDLYVYKIYGCLVISIIYRRVNIQKYVENPWFTGKKSTNGGFSTSMLVYRMENYLKNRVGLRASRS